MSSYLNLYLVPKRAEGDTEEPEPLLLKSWSRNSNMYKLFHDYCNPVFTGIGDKPQYSKLIPADLLYGIGKEKEIIDKYEQRLNDRLITIKELGNAVPKEIVDEYLDDVPSTKEYIAETRETLKEAGILLDLISCDFSDFEEVWINID